MAKRPVKKKVAVKKKGISVPKRVVYPCKVHGLGKCNTVYMRVEKSGNAADGRTHYCAAEFKKVDGVKKEEDRKTVARYKAAADKRAAKGKGGGLRNDAKKASASKRIVKSPKKKRIR